MRGKWMGPWFAIVGCFLLLGAVARTQAVEARDPLFAGTEKFARNAVSIVQVDSGPVTLEAIESGSSRRHNSASVVYVFGYEKAGAYDPADVEFYKRKLQTADWSCSTKTQDLGPGEYKYACLKTLRDGYFESATIEVKNRSLAFIHKIGRHPPVDNDSDN